MISSVDIKILTAALAANLSLENSKELILALSSQPEVIVIAQAFGSSKLIREIRLARNGGINEKLLKLEKQGNQVLYQSRLIGKIQILYKSPLPGELQARLAIESITERFLDYLQKVYKIVVLAESDYHVQVFIPQISIPDFKKLWETFLIDVAFSVNGYTKFQLPGLAQTFIVMLNVITLSGRGFSTLDVPILTQEQSKVLAALYFAVYRDVKNRQEVRQNQIDELLKELALLDTSSKDYKNKQKELQEKEFMQSKEEQKYTEYFRKSFGKTLEEQNILLQDVKKIQSNIASSKLSKNEKSKLEKQLDKLSKKIIFTEDSIKNKLNLFRQSQGNPFYFVEKNKEQYPNLFSNISGIAEKFNKTATKQISSSRGDIFTQCILEMYILLESQHNEELPPAILTQKIILPEMRSPGDESKEFCYSCGVALEPKTAKWKVLRFMFERPSQRRQSSSGEGRPHICASCSALSFASPLKVTDESIILRLDVSGRNFASELKAKDYIRMLTNKGLHLSAGRYIVLPSDRTNGGELASEKLGQLQYALAKVASIFPLEVIPDFNFSLIIQGTQSIPLLSRYLILIKGLMESYSQSIIIAGKDINITLGGAIRYVQKDLPYLAEYTITKVAKTANYLEFEQIREAYWKVLQKNLESKGESMEPDNQLSKRAKLYKDVAALTGLTYAFTYSLETTAKSKRLKPEDVEREVSKIIEKVEDAVAFCYYATLGVTEKVEARLWRNLDNYFIYEQTKILLEELKIEGREEKDNSGKTWLKIYADDVLKAYAHFADNGYSQDKDWKDLTYQLKLSLYTRFPELVRKLKTTSEK